MTYTNKEITQIFEIMAPYIQERSLRHFTKKKKKELSYEVLEVELNEVPLFSESREPHERALARWRLENKK